MTTRTDTQKAAAMADAFAPLATMGQSEVACAAQDKAGEL